MSRRVLELHHDQHHRGYVQNANLAVAELEKARQTNELTRVPALEHSLAFNLAGHLLHSVFWQNLTPNGGGKPDGELAAAIQRDFGSFEKFKWQMIQAASTQMGSGWAGLVWEPAAGRLLTVQIHDHQSDVSQGGIPLLVLDAWEHAYYLQYENRKNEFFEAIWNLWNWRDVAMRFDAAKKVDMRLLDVAAA